jgi:RNA-directed DNA polymerase
LRQRRWIGYFGFCETPEVLIGLTLRSAATSGGLWRQWKTPRRRRAALLELGVPKRLASKTAGSFRWIIDRAV